MSKANLHIKKGDKVLVLSGKAKGSKGRVLYVLPEDNRAAVEGLNMIKKHARPSQKNPSGGITEKEAPINASNLMLICPKCDKQIRARRHVLADGKVRRRCPECGEIYS